MIISFEVKNMTIEEIRTWINSDDNKQITYGYGTDKLMAVSAVEDILDEIQKTYDL